MCYNYSIETDNGNEEMISRDYAIVIADEALNFNRTTTDVLNEGWNACLDEFARLNKGAGSHE